MKSNLLIVVLVIQLFCGFSRAQDKVFRVMSYNIMDGFDNGKDTVRQVKTANWIKTQQPNVLALQELCGYTDLRLQKEARQWGHQFSVLLKSTGYSVGITSNQPISLIERKTAGLWHGMLHVEVNGINFFVVHFSPSDYLIRRKEADTILIRVKSLMAEGKHCVVLGDFNSTSPFDDDLNKTKTFLLERNIAGDAKSTSYKDLANNYFDYSVIGKFLAARMIDLTQKYVTAAQRYTYSTPLLIGRYRKNMDEVEKTRHRLDYIMVSPALALKSTGATIINGSATGHLSDHYPVIADFNLSDK